MLLAPSGDKKATCLRPRRRAEWWFHSAKGIPDAVRTAAPSIQVSAIVHAPVVGSTRLEASHSSAYT